MAADAPSISAIGLMSGTSMDGVDGAVLVTDGETVEAFGPRCFRAYTTAEREALRNAVAAARSLADRMRRPTLIAEAERVVTDAHGEVVERLKAEAPAAQLVGFHGQTVLHAPERRLTVQIGDGVALARKSALPVVFDFRAADVLAGGEGAPFVPVYHRALVERAGLAGTTAVVNIGGVANITRIADDGAMAAGDVGPGNALIDDWVRATIGRPMDEGGALAAMGRVDDKALASLLADPWFRRPLPKSLDRDAFSLGAVSGMSVEDGAATLTAFTSRAIVKGIVMAGGADRLVVVGGGAANPTLRKMLAADAVIPVIPAEELGWSPDFIEAEAFAYLAVRSLRGLPLSFPGTTGVPEPMTGGLLVRPAGG